jgi:hypothetical protein
MGGNPRQDAEDDLIDYAMTVSERDPRVLRAHKAGVSKRRISALSGLARMTVGKILDRKDRESGDD